MAFTPFIWLANILYLTKLYDKLVKLPGCIGLFFFYLKLICSVIFGMILIIPMPVPITLHIGNPLTKKNNETLLEFTKRCEYELQELYLSVNKRKHKDIILALSERF